MGIALLRPGELVSNLFSVFGNIKETSLTACLAFIISKYPDTFGSLFTKNEEIRVVKVEFRTNDFNRHDIVLESDNGLTIIEAKLGFNQVEQQIIKYIKELSKEKKQIKLILLDSGSWQSSSWTKKLSGKLNKRLKKKVTMKFLLWAEVHAKLSKLIDSKKIMKTDPAGYYVARELINYMEVNGMSSIKSREVYCRDLTEKESVELFFRHHVYISQPKYFLSANGNRYFAPIFTKAAPKFFNDKSSIRLGIGISYIAGIKDIQIVARNEVKNFLRKSCVPDPKNAVKLALNNKNVRKEFLILILNEPMQAFLTPLNKKQLKILGMTGSRSLTFQQLFEVAQGVKF